MARLMVMFGLPLVKVRVTSGVTLLLLLTLAMFVFILELSAIRRGINGKCLAIALTILGAIVGWIVRSVMP